MSDLNLNRAVSSVVLKASKSSDPEALSLRLTTAADTAERIGQEKDVVVAGQCLASLEGEVSSLAAEIAVSAIRKKEAKELMPRLVELQERVASLKQTVHVATSKAAKKEVSDELKVRCASVIRTLKKAGIGYETDYGMDSNQPAVTIAFKTTRKPSPMLICKEGSNVLVVGENRSEVRIDEESQLASIKRALLMRGYKL